MIARLRQMARCDGFSMRISRGWIRWVVRTAQVDFKRPLEIERIVVRTWVDEITRRCASAFRDRETEKTPAVLRRLVSLHDGQQATGRRNPSRLDRGEITRSKLHHSPNEIHAPFLPAAALLRARSARTMPPARRPGSPSPATELARHPRRADPGGEIRRFNYLEAYCRAGSTDADWVQPPSSSIPPNSSRLSARGEVMKLHDALADGVTVEHTITAGPRSGLRLPHAIPPRRAASSLAQPCVRLGAFTGFDPLVTKSKTSMTTLGKCFIFLEANSRACHAAMGHAGALHPGPGVVARKTCRALMSIRAAQSLVPSNGLDRCGQRR